MYSCSHVTPAATQQSVTQLYVLMAVCYRAELTSVCARRATMCVHRIRRRLLGRTRQHLPHARQFRAQTFMSKESVSPKMAELVPLLLLAFGRSASPCPSRRGARPCTPSTFRQMSLTHHPTHFDFWDGMHRSVPMRERRLRMAVPIGVDACARRVR